MPSHVEELYRCAQQASSDTIVSQSSEAIERAHCERPYFVYPVPPNYRRTTILDQRLYKSALSPANRGETYGREPFASSSPATLLESGFEK